MAPMKASSASAAAPHSSAATDPAIMARKNSSRIWLACCWSCMWSSITRLSAMLRTALNPTRLTARETVLTVPRLAWAKCTLLTSRKSLCVSATSLRISCVRSLILSSSELATRWMRATESDNAGKSLLCRMRRSKKSSVALLAAVGALTGAAQARSASRKSAAEA